MSPIAITANWKEADQSIAAVKIGVSEATAGMVADLVMIGERVAKQTAPKDTSGLARDIIGESRGLVGSVMVPGAGRPTTIGQAITQELGRRPGMRMPPPLALYGWAERHGFDLSKVDKSDPKKFGVLWVLARSIGRKGYPGKGYMEQARQAMLQAIPGVVTENVRKLRGGS